MVGARAISVLIVSVVFAGLGARYAGAGSKLIAAVNIAPDRQAHIVLDDGREHIVPKEKDQADCVAAKLAEDRRTAGWLIESNNCFIGASSCQSYPIPLTLVIYRDGKIIQRFTPGQSIWDWRFLKGGSQVAFWTGPTHGDFTPHFELHSVMNGGLLAKWDGHVDEQHPDWISGLKE